MSSVKSETLNFNQRFKLQWRNKMPRYCFSRQWVLQATLLWLYWQLTPWIAIRPQ